MPKLNYEYSIKMVPPGSHPIFMLSGVKKLSCGFHFNTRCETCRAVESETKMNVEELFGGEVEFTAVNLDEKEGEAKGKELDVNSQSLLIVKGNKKINITNEGFLYAQTNPDKFRKIIEEKIKPLL